ncbi:MAG: sugar transferase [Anaerolineae bacterium]
MSDKPTLISMDDVPVRAVGGAGRWVKAMFDRLFALIGLIILLPLFAIIVLLIRLDSPGPAFFRQVRVGKDGRPFRIYKFRTMVVGAEKIGLGVQTRADDPRITRVGRILRKLSLDELPQLINILKGEMSFVGPRPTLPYQVLRYSPRQKGRLLVPPGVTGWAQIHGRKTLTWPERIEYDIWYVEHWSLWLDLCILLRTLPAILTARGVDDAGIGDEISRLEPAQTEAEERES